MRLLLPVGHYWAAWVTIGALLAHAGAKASITAAVARRGLPTDSDDAVAATGGVNVAADGTLSADGGLTRRTMLAATAGVSELVVATSVGGTVRPTPCSRCGSRVRTCTWITAFRCG